VLDPNKAIANNSRSRHLNLMPLEFLSTMHKCQTLDLCLTNSVSENLPLCEF
jgi:hypothetical protein